MKVTRTRPRPVPISVVLELTEDEAQELTGLIGAVKHPTDFVSEIWGVLAAKGLNTDNEAHNRGRDAIRRNDEIAARRSR